MNFMLPVKREQNVLSPVSIVKRMNPDSTHAVVVEPFYLTHAKSLSQEQVGRVLPNPLNPM